MSQGRPDWNRDETLLALDLYIKNPLRSFSKGSKEVVELCLDIDRLHTALGTPRPEGMTFRNPASIIMKLSNFRSLDKENHLDCGRSGLRGASAEDRRAWSEFSGKPGILQGTTTTIRDAIQRGVRLDVAYDREGIEEASEGALLTRLHVVRERNARLRKARIEMAGKSPACEGCGFDFSRNYGSHGEGYIECHHIVPLHTLASAVENRLSDLALVCSNCHRMIHRRREWLDMDSLRVIARWQGLQYCSML